MFRHSPIWLAASVVLLTGAAVHAQQSRPERPYRGLFAGSDTPQPVQESLSVSGSLGGGYDTDLAEDARSVTLVNLPDRHEQRRGALGQFSGALSYSLAGANASLAASAGSTGRYYSSGSEKRILRRDNASVQGVTRLGAGVSVVGGASYAPFRVSDLYSTALVGGPGEASDAFDFGTSPEHYLAYNGGVEGDWQASRRVSLVASYRYSGSAASLEVPHVRSHQGGGNLRYNLGRGLDMILGYRYNEARYAEGAPYVTHGIDAGIDFRRALSFSRRTTLSFRTGTKAADDPTTGEGLQFHAVGDVALNHEIGRTWKATAGYDRNLQFSENWPTPIFSDALSLSLDGLVTRRIAFHSRGGASRGSLSTGDGAGFATYFGDAGMTFALGRHAALGTSYRYHKHRFPDGFSDVPGIPSALERHSVQAYLSVWAPIFQRTRRP